MFSVRKLIRNAYPLITQARLKSKTHWAKLKKKNGPKDKALNHFDDFYGSAFGKKWDPMREALLRKSKYVAVVNNYGDTEDTMEFLSNRGAHCLRQLMTVQNEHNTKFSKAPDIEGQSGNRVQEFVAKVQSDDISSVYGDKGVICEKLETPDITLLANQEEKDPKSEINISKETKTAEESLVDAGWDQSRIIDPSYGAMSEALWQFIPATKLKGMEEWVPESVHYSYYSNSKDFPLIVEPETSFTFPEYLKVYTYELDSESGTFPEPKRSKTGVFNYYPMDAGSVLSVLALCLQAGDRVLDLCAAPGGKSLVALQTLLPDIMVCNDASLSRCNRMKRVFNDYLMDFEVGNKWREKVLLKHVDGRMYRDEVGFDKVLVDVPCTTDRHSVMEDENNIFRPDRVKERLRIPELQSQLLVNALSLVKVGGAVVYSTCSLSPVQNDGVVHMALKQAFEGFGIIATVRDLSASLSGFSSTLQLASGAAAPRYGHLVTPHIGANFGPTYFVRLVRTK